MTLVGDAMKILIVDDDEDDFLRISMALNKIVPSSTIVRVYTAADGLSKADGADLVILDLILPDTGSARATVDAFASVIKTTLVIVVSGIEDVELVLCAMDAGAVGYVYKSKLRSMIETAVRDVLEFD